MRMPVRRRHNAGLGPVSPVKTQAALSFRAHGKAHRRHGVLGRQHFDPPATERQRLADRKRFEPQQRMLGAGQAGEVGPDEAVEDVGAQCLQRLRQRVYSDRPAAAVLTRQAPPGHTVGQQADAQHMVEVRVRDQDVVDARHLVEREVADAGAGVDQHVVVEQKGGGAVASCDGAGATEHANLHVPIFLCGEHPRPHTLLRT
jgi:hypothetical protein